MQLEKVRNAFEKKGYSSNSFISKREFVNCLNSFVRGEPFHDEVADELWNQAGRDSVSQQLRVDDVCYTIVDAQNILKTRIGELNDQISLLEKEKRKLQSSPSRDSVRRIEEIDFQLQDLYSDKQSFEDDYKMVTEPFGIQMISSMFKNLNASQGIQNDPRDSFTPDQATYSGHVQSEDLRILLYLTLIFGFIEIIMIFDKYDFLNLIVVTCLLSIYLMNFFDRLYIRFTLGLLVVSIVLDFVWLFLEAGQKWNPPEVGNNSKYETGYLRFIVFFTAALIPLKLGIGYFLYKHRNAGVEDKYALTLGTMQIKLSANKSNPISKGISSNLAN